MGNKIKWEINYWNGIKKESDCVGRVICILIFILFKW